MDQQQPAISARALSPDQIDALEDRFYAFNAGRTGHRDYAQLAFVAEIDGSTAGAVAGYSWGGYCELRQLWIDQTHRGKGLGRRLMTRAIHEARSRGCGAIYLFTFSFQAPDFYAGFGFERVCELRDKPRGHSDILMRLDLTQPL